MNLNFFRTIMGALTGTGILTMIVKFAGCTMDDPATVIVEATTCEGSTFLASISPLATSIGTLVLLVLGGIAKMMKSGTVTQNLVSPSVPVVSSEDAKPGVVTPGQVAASGANK